MRENNIPSFHVPVSPEALSIVVYLNRSQEKRNLVNYNLTFLESYEPNISYYLPKAIREELETIAQGSTVIRKSSIYPLNSTETVIRDLAWNSSRLEDNTYTLFETERLLFLGEIAQYKTEEEAIMVYNHKMAIEFLYENLDKISLNNGTINQLHRLLSKNLVYDEKACGLLRRVPVRISGTVYKPLNVPESISSIFSKILEKASSISHPFEQAFFLMVHLPYLQPFVDVNKRVSRIAMNIPLLKNSLPPLTFIDLPRESYVQGLLGVYELNQIERLRDIFVWAYKQSVIGQHQNLRLLSTIARSDISRIIKESVTRNLNQKQAILHIQKWADLHVDPSYQRLAIQAAEEELLNISKDNLSNSDIPLITFEKWDGQWHERKLSAEEQAKNYRKQLEKVKIQRFNERLCLDIAVSVHSYELRESIRRPLEDRQPATYSRELLEAYRPNISSYLPEEVRAQLKERGSLPVSERKSFVSSSKRVNPLLQDFAQNSCRLEGSYFSPIETEHVLFLNQTVTKKSPHDVQMLLNQYGAIEFLFENCEGINFDPQTIFQLHQILLDRLVPESRLGGQLRKQPLEVEGSGYHPLASPEQIEECFYTLISKASQIEDPFEQAFFAMTHISYLKPFECMNDSLARLIVNMPLIQNGLCPVTYIDVPIPAYREALFSLYEMSKLPLILESFVWAYRRSTGCYTVLGGMMGEVNSFRIHYEKEIKDLTRKVIIEKLNQEEAVGVIQQWARKNIPLEHQTLFIEATESDIVSAHPFIVLGYGLEPEAFDAWQERWHSH